MTSFNEKKHCHLYVPGIYDESYVKLFLSIAGKISAEINDYLFINSF